MFDQDKSKSDYFIFRKANNDKSSIEIDFNSQFNQVLGVKLEIIPVFNNDSDPSLPGFTIRYDLPQLYSRLQESKDSLKQKYEESLKKIKILIDQKPKENKCQMCNEIFSDYNKHIKSSKHLNKFRFNDAFKQIQRISTEYLNTEKYKNNDADSNQTGLADDFEPFIEQQIQKKIKIDSICNDPYIDIDWLSQTSQGKTQGQELNCIRDENQYFKLE